MADYRLSELATASGVSARNVRAYRERGLLDPPRREGRAAFYDDHHLAQLRTINELLGKGYTSAHILEFFESMRRGHNLADILGLQQALFGETVHPRERDGTGNVDPTDADVRRLVDRGLAQEDGGELQWRDARTADILAGVEDPRDYLKTMLRVSDGTAALLDDVAVAVVDALRAGVVERFGPKYVPMPDDMAELEQMVRDYRKLATRVIAVHLNSSLRRRLVQAMSDYTTDIIAREDDAASL